jgi:hypothetical protein
MHDAKDLLERAERLAPAPTFTFEDLEQTGVRHAKRKRIGTAAFALTLAAIAFGSAVVALRQPGASTIGSSGPTEPFPPATEAPVVAGPGAFYYRAVLFYAEGCSDVIAAPCGDPPELRLDATYWWRDDDAGRIVVDQRVNYGIDPGRFEAGGFPDPNGTDVSDFPLGRAALTRFLLERSAPNGASPAPLVTPPPEGAPNDGQLWRAITDLLQDPHVSPTVRASLLDVAAGLQGARVQTDLADPFGRRAHVVTFGNWGGDATEKLYVDPVTHELLAWTAFSTVDDAFMVYVVQDAGVVASTEVAPKPDERSVPLTLLSPEDLADIARGR